MKTAKEKNETIPGGFVPMLVRAGLRPTRQRLLLAEILFGAGDIHVTVEQVMTAVRKRRGRVSLATVYNTLNQFTQAGLLRQVPVNRSCAWFDTNLSDHSHFFDEVEGRLWDIPDGALRLDLLPKPPAGRRLAGVDVVVRLGKEDQLVE